MQYKDVPRATEILNLDATAKQPHPGGANGTFVDGSIHFLSATMEPAVLRALISINGNDGAALQGAF